MNFQNSFFRKNYIIFLLFAAFCFASLFVNGFFNIHNIFNLLNQNAIKCIVAIGMTFLILSGYFDMSAGSIVGLSAALTCGLQTVLPTLSAILVALLAGAAIGFLNGILVTRFKVNAFLITLATMFGTRGIAYLYHQGDSILLRSPSLLKFGTGRIGFISYTSILLFLLLLISSFFLSNTFWGRSVYTIGDNPEAAYYAGIPIQKVITLNFILSGLFAAFGGILYASVQGASTPELGWGNLQINIITAVLLGGTSLEHGIGNVWYTLGGVMLLGILENMLTLLNIDTYVNTIINGLIIIAILSLNRFLMPKNYGTHTNVNGELK